MPWSPRPDPSLMTGELDTTETAGPTARMGHIEQISDVFAVASAIDRARAGYEREAGQQPEQLANAIGSSPRPRHAADAERSRWEALVASQRAVAQLAARGLVFDQRTGGIVRMAPTAPPGAGMGTMLTVDEETQ
jgi:hypothetical protein